MNGVALIIKKIIITFQKIPTTEPKPTPEEFKKKWQLILTNIGVQWYVKN